VKRLGALSFELPSSTLPIRNLSRKPTPTVGIWIAGMVILASGVALRLAGDKPGGAAILVLGVLMLVLSRFDNLRRR